MTEVFINVEGKVLSFDIHDSLSISTVQEKFVQSIMDDPTLGQKVRESIPLLMIQHKKFGLVQVPDGYIFHEGQMVFVQCRALDLQSADVNADLNSESHQTPYTPQQLRDHQKSYDENLSQTKSLDNSFLEVRKFFTDMQWNKLAEEERIQARNVLHRYKYMKDHGVPIREPYFMQGEIQATEQRQQRSTKAAFKAPYKSSMQSSTSSTVQEERNLTEPGESNLSETNMQSGLEGLVERQSLKLITNQPRQKPKKIIRTFDRRIAYPAPLPVLGSKSLSELEKRKIERNMKHIHADCKAHIRKLTGGDEYLSRAEWDNYCKTMVEKYPTLGNQDDGVVWASFKLSLQKSFSASRKNLKKKQLKQNRHEEENPDDDVAERDEPNEAEKADAKLRGEMSLNKDDTTKLLMESLPFRRTERLKMSPSELLEAYSHLKISEMMIYDYIISINKPLADLEATFNRSCHMVGDYYLIEPIDEASKLNILMKAHEFFLSKAVEKKIVKPVLLLTEESQKGVQEMNSTEFQAPIIVIMKKQNFLTAKVELRSATLLMNNCIISSMHKPHADKIAMLLMAAYFTLNVEYPKPYQQFLRALEKLLTGKCAPSIYGQSQVKFNRFISLLKK